MKSGTEQGMTLRDWFAAQAVGHIWRDEWKYEEDDEDAARVCALIAYEIADAMMKVRKGE